MFLSVDIETVPRPGIMDTWYPSWAAEKHPDKTPEELEALAALYPEFGMVCAISVVKQVQGMPQVAAEYTASNLEEEGAMLKDFCGRLDRGRDVVLVGHNIKGFDIPFIVKRCLAHGLFVPDCMKVAGKKPWDIPHRDTMEILKCGGFTPMSLRSACLLLGFEDPKEVCDGRKVWDLFRQGDLGKVSQYCTGDAKAAMLVYLETLKA